MSGTISATLWLVLVGAQSINRSISRSVGRRCMVIFSKDTEVHMYTKLNLDMEKRIT